MKLTIASLRLALLMLYMSFAESFSPNVVIVPIFSFSIRGRSHMPSSALETDPEQKRIIKNSSKDFFIKNGIA